MQPVLTNFDIKYAESVLLRRNETFDRERLDYIKNFDTIDLQAVPGSGKTTSLLAKLLIIEKHLPFPDDSGILVLSHTNTAVDEIKDRIGVYCPKLFTYPNFIGTIQSFVDQFLAIPYYHTLRKKSHVRIDNEIYAERIESAMKRCLNGENSQVFRKVKHIFNVNPKLIYKFRFGHDVNGNVCLCKNVYGERLEISKPRGNTLARNYTDYTEEEKGQVTSYLRKVKKDILTKGIMCFDDAYFLADRYLEKFPQIIRILQNRFKYVFVDEMQDMDVHQYRLLDRLFYRKHVKGHVFQRIGDKNQAIFSGAVKLDEIWLDREKTLRLKGSHRLSPQIANVAKYFGLSFIEIEGRNSDSTLPPTLLVFNNQSINNVIQHFGGLVRLYQSNDTIPTDLEHPIKVVGWVREHSDADKLGIKDYYDQYCNPASAGKIDYPNLKSYLVNNDRLKGAFRPLRRNIFNAFLKALRLESIENNGRPFSKSSLLKHLKENHEKIYEELELNIFSWSMSIINDQVDNAKEECAAYFRKLVEDVFDKENLSQKVINFLDSDQEGVPYPQTLNELSNVYVHDGLEIEIGTVHSAKGETHVATLYLETNYHKHESQKSKNQLLGNKILNGSDIRVNESARMMYVGFSRPTHFLCFAAHEDRINEKMRNSMMARGWEIINVTSE